jgi:hypothetical protein
VIDTRNRALKSALKFDDDDLAANRAGKLADSQKKQYDTPQMSPLVQAVIFGHLVGVGGLIALIALISGEPAMWLVLAVVLGLAGLPFFMMKNEAALRPVVTADVRRGVVEQTCGTVFVQKAQSQQRGAHYTLTVEGVQMTIPAKAFTAFRHGERYCVYYLPNSKTFISAEAIE